MDVKHRILLSAAALALGICLAAPAGFAREGDGIIDTQTVAFKAPQLKDWQSASANERYSFLVGLVTMFEAEREWQSVEKLPVDKSSISLWEKGLSGVTFRDMHDAIDAYIAANPDDMDEQVLTVLGRIYVRPVMTEKQLEQARARLAAIEKANR